jgi:ribulose-phosphate 3-epimerase
MVNIIPAILESDIHELQHKLDLLANLVDYAQIDLMDGQFVDTTSVRPEELNSLRTNLFLEAHLMVKDPGEWLQYLNPDIFKRVYFHIEAVSEPGELIRAIKEAGFEAGLAINPATPIDSLKEYAEYVEGVLFMSVAPGAQGREFHPEVLEKIKEFSLECANLDIAIDGGVTESNIFSIAEAGVTNICVGSSIFAGGDIKNNIQQLKDRLT